MPSVIYEGDSHVNTKQNYACYILPPIQYPDGKNVKETLEYEYKSLLIKPLYSSGNASAFYLLMKSGGPPKREPLKVWVHSCSDL